tara:strand:- start:228 stop:431 length:204 start_codon:yes stop_codon:yes gene_type:complete
LEVIIGFARKRRHLPGVVGPLHLLYKVVALRHILLLHHRILLLPHLALSTTILAGNHFQLVTFIENG